jgi:hypothetical protein
MAFLVCLLLAVGLGLVFSNVVATREVWRSPAFEPSQKIAQTVLVWLVPGSVAVVWYVLRERGFGGGGSALSSVDASVAAWLSGGGRSDASAGSWHHAGSGHHGGGSDSGGSDGGSDGSAGGADGGCP